MNEDTSPANDLFNAARRFRDVHGEWLKTGSYEHARYADATAALQVAALEYARAEDPK